MKRYTFQIVITEGNDEFWESVQGMSGCDEVVGVVQRALFEYGFQEGYGTEIKLVKFEDYQEQETGQCLACGGILSFDNVTCAKCGNLLPVETK